MLCLPAPELADALHPVPRAVIEGTESDVDSADWRVGFLELETALNLSNDSKGLSATSEQNFDVLVHMKVS